MDEVSSHVCLVLPSTDGKAARKIVPPRLRIPYWKGLGADSEEKHEPVSDIDTVVVDSLKALDPKRPIREADIVSVRRHVSKVPIADIVPTKKPYPVLAGWDFRGVNVGYDQCRQMPSFAGTRT